jgi:3-hydroxyisobutyrate dehydrogenase-like beta-hydroxyacid dehydrogenase
MTIGFIGLGLMGQGVAANLLKSGQEVRVWNRSPGPVKALVDQGAAAAPDPQSAFQSDVVFTMLGQDDAVEAVVVQSGALAGARPGSVHINLATISIALAKRLEDLHRDKGVGYVAAPVLGRPDVAAKGELNVLCAGEAAVVNSVRPLLDQFAKAVWPVGEEPHKANVVKLAINFALASMIETLGETGALAKAYGLDPEALFNVMTSTLFAAPAYKTYAALIAAGQFSPAAFKLPLGLKDVRLALAAGEAVNLPLPLASVIRDNFIEAIAAGDGDKDWSALAAGSFRRSGQAVG